MSLDVATCAPEAHLGVDGNSGAAGCVVTVEQGHGCVHVHDSATGGGGEQWQDDAYLAKALVSVTGATPARRRRPRSQPRRFLQPNVPRQWRHRLAPADRRHRRPWGAPSLWTRTRTLLFTWWLWGGAAIWATATGELGHAAWLGLVAVFMRLAAPLERPAALRTRAPDGRGHQGVPRERGGGHRRAVRGRQPRDRAQQRRRVLSGDARRHPPRAAVGHHRGLYLLERRGRPPVRARAGRSRAPRRAGQDPARCRRLGHHRHGDPEDPRRGRLPACLVPPDSLVHDRALQPAHASQDAARGRTRGVHRRRRHRRPVERPRPGPGPLARRAGARRGSGRRAAADRVRRELAGDDRRAGHRRGLLPAARAPLARYRCRR